MRYLMEMFSIKQKQAINSLPDFRNFGVILRILLGINLLALVAALIQSQQLATWLLIYVNISAWVQPALLFGLILLALFSPLLKYLSIWAGRGIVMFIAILSSSLIALLWNWVGLETDSNDLIRTAILSAFAAAIMLYYFAARAKAGSPALAEARIQALTARIRPHFLFNSLNAVLSLVRTEPRRAEMALEELADLFRVLMRDHRDMLPIAEELLLCRQYLNLEKIRLQERLRVEWDIAELPQELKVPPLFLQPLLENAVYHGIEPSEESGTIRIQFRKKGHELHIRLTNPCPSNDQGRRGQHMALDNVRERLNLCYDLEALLETEEITLETGQKEYHVHIILPYKN